LKINQEIYKLKESFSVNLAGNKTINNSNDDYLIITLSNGSNQVGTESVVSNNNQTSDQRKFVEHVRMYLSVATLYMVK
jgi:hypothetical protein